MKLLLFLGFATACAVAAASTSAKFYDQLTPAQREAAGIQHLTEAQRAALSALADAWVATKADDAIRHERARAVAEVRAEAEFEKKRRLGFDDAPKPDDVIRTRIAGPFRGWGKGTIFQLENGQRWAVDNSGVEPRYFSLRENPEVEIRPSTFGTWKFYILPEGLWVRVRRLE